MLKRPTTSQLEIPGKIRGYSSSLVFSSVKSSNEEAEAFCIGTLVPKMSFWQRVKYLFTGRVPAEAKKGKISPPPFDVDEFKNDSNKQIVSERHGYSYTTFAGCDMKIIFIHGLEEGVSREEIERTYFVGQDLEKRKDHCVVVGEAQTISVRTVWPEESDVPKTIGDLSCIQFDASLFDKLSEINGNFHLMCVGANEYGDLATFILPNFSFTSWSWGIAADDLVSEELFTFEADEPMYWNWMKSPSCSG